MLPAPLPNNRSGLIRGRRWVLLFLRMVPYVMLLSTVATVIWTVQVLWATGATWLFPFYFPIVVQVYMNWMAVRMSRDRFDVRAATKTVVQNGTVLQRAYYCPRCRVDTAYECRHCPLCETCVAQRGHHCFLMGTCITRHSMKHFMAVCVYGSAACFFSGLTFLSDCKMPKAAVYLAPVALGYYLSGLISFSKLVYSFVINLELSSGVLIVGFMIHHLFLAAVGRLPYCDQEDVERGSLRNLVHLFDGPIGFLNLVVPFSALGHKKAKSQSYSKSV
ncbi:palmitoyltransferase ZDHHC22-like [Neocloeon triangulifer]|uniref:palmitoyltransferase ZDHHC22-like n=1 Tax=Neocloeon triangulifer TaxID=2078957 RepID=UPI00286F3C37|nr:palmitoyltransferase ZDHHC22-like [Neocloeon triangulifer]